MTRLLLVPVALLACHPVQERHDPFPDEDFTDPVEVTVTVGGELVARVQLSNPMDYTIELRPDGDACTASYRWFLELDEVVVRTSSPEPPATSASFMLGSETVRYWVEEGDALREVSFTGGTARFETWTAEHRSLTLTGAEQCVGVRGEEPTCAPAPPVTVAIRALDEDPELPGQTCYLSTMPVPDWPEPGPGPCAYAETRCP